MNSYRDYIDARERSCMTANEKLEKRNSEIISLYTTTGNNIIPQNITPETVKIEREKYNE